MQVAKAQIHRSISDWLRWSIAGLILIGIVFSNYYFVNVSASLKLVGDLLLFLVLLGIISFTKEGHHFWRFAKDAKNELRRVIWPKRSETIHTTLIIVGVVIIVALFLWAIDSALFWLMSFINGQRG